MFAPETGPICTKPTWEIQASMRPGHVCPGNAPPSCSPSLPDRGFNEAGACLPRKVPLLRLGKDGDTGFNEAGACLPRKAARSFTSSGDRSGFNEAGACLPRKPAALLDDLVVGRRASMRPGHVCPGKPRPDFGRSALAELQ